MIHATRNQRFWYALYTRPRFEKKVDAILKEKGLLSFLPQRNIIKYWSNGKKNIDEPLFPSYVFVHADINERYSALQTYGVARFVSFNGKPAKIPQDQIESIYCILKNGYETEPYTYLYYGDKVRILSGPLKDYEGYYVRNKGKHQLIICVDFIHQAIAVTIDKRFVLKINSQKKEISI